MDALSEKQMILELVHKIYADLMGLVESLSLKEKTARGSLKQWSAKDMVAHLVFWERHFNNQLDKLAKNEKIPVAGDYLHQVNDGVLVEHMDQTLEDALNEYQQIHTDLLDKYGTFSAEDLSDPKKFAWLEGRPMSDRILGNSVWHPLIHIADFYMKRVLLEKATQIQVSVADKLNGFPALRANAVYNLACFYALNGMGEKAIPYLKEAFMLKPDLLDWSKQDSDLISLRELPEFKALF